MLLTTIVGMVGAVSVLVGSALFSGSCSDDTPVPPGGACSTASECTVGDTPFPMCFKPDCISGRCVNTVLPDAVCTASACRNGAAQTNVTCGAAGSCTGPALDVKSCEGFRCDEAGKTCLSSCSKPEHCAASYTCSGGLCQTTLKKVGESCSDQEPCVADADCVSGTCLARPGTYCENNQQCTSAVCVAHLCKESLAGLLEACDEGADCADGRECQANMCRNIQGKDCNADAQCTSGHCECVDSPCVNRVCAAADCLCGYGTSGSCSAGMMGGTTDPEDCDTAGYGCFGKDTCNQK